MSKLLKAKKLIECINEAGYEAYIIGGYVRDLLLGFDNQDIDIATSAHPTVVKQLFSKTILTGIDHGTVTVIFEGVKFEVTTYRTDGKYLNNRRPKDVHFVSSLQTDIKRRDFTINALALDNYGNLIDYVDGKKDIEAKLIRTVGAPEARFNEDALRMLRAFRFVAKLGFNIEQETLSAIKKVGSLIQNISAERILMELEKMIYGNYFFVAIEVMINTKFHHFLPHLKSGIEKIAVTKFLPTDLSEFLTICAVCGAYHEIVELPLSKQMIRKITLVYEMYSLEISEFSNLILYRNGLESCLLTNKLNVFLRNKDDLKEKIIAKYNSLPIYKICDLKFKGDDIINLYSKKPGSWIGMVLDDLSLKVLNGELKNEYNELKNYLINKHGIE
jgi:tRNA nucleotidyltransferase (CCA-adding enzyme)